MGTLGRRLEDRRENKFGPCLSSCCAVTLGESSLFAGEVACFTVCFFIQRETRKNLRGVARQRIDGKKRNSDIGIAQEGF